MNNFNYAPMHKRTHAVGTGVHKLYFTDLYNLGALSCIFSIYFLCTNNISLLPFLIVPVELSISWFKLIRSRLLFLFPCVVHVFVFSLYFPPLIWSNFQLYPKNFLFLKLLTSYVNIFCDDFLLLWLKSRSPRYRWLTDDFLYKEWSNPKSS